MVHGLVEASRGQYDSSIVVTSSERPKGYTGPWLFLPYLDPARPWGFLARLIPNLLRLRKLLKDAVAANPHFGGLECLPLLLLRRLRLGPPVILSIHGADLTEFLTAGTQERKLYRWMFETADLVVGCSRDLVQKLAPLSPHAKTAVVWNATSPMPEVSTKRPVENPYLLCVAAFVKKKAQQNLVAAFERIRTRHTDLELVFIGSDGAARQELEAQIQSAGLASHVRILLDQPSADVWWWMRHAACFVLPSREEPFGIVLLEAGKSRVPVVATRVGGVPEFLIHKEHGLLCDPDRPDQLADAILETLENKEETAQRVEAFYRHASGFTWARAFDQYRSFAALP